MVITPRSTPPLVRASPSWWRSPQRVWLRRAIFQVHLWAGIVISLYAIVIGLTGSILVFRPEIQDALDRRAVALAPQMPGQQSASLRIERSVRAIEAARPGWYATGLEKLATPTSGITLLLQTRPPSAGNRQVLFNPQTGQVYADRMRFAGFLGFTTNLHYYLLGGHTGLIVSGWMAVCMLVLLVTGLVLWWPGVRRGAKALWLRRGVSPRRFNWDLHSVLGFWFFLPLLLVTITGIYFAFPDPVRDLLLFLTAGSPEVVEKVAAAHKLPSSKQPLLNIDQVLDVARRALPPDAPPGYLFIPPRRERPYFVTGYYVGALPFSHLVQITIDPSSGAILAHSDTGEDNLASRFIQYSFTVHFGSFGGDGVLKIVVKLLWVAVGCLPALLAVTGLLMYWNRKLRRYFM